uniref:Uncharacterized protein n=1 Tax=Arundo donax TaxID=35708 RepID=A0A0A8YRC5_ARUDO
MVICSTSYQIFYYIPRKREIGNVRKKETRKEAAIQSRNKEAAIQSRKRETNERQPVGSIRGRGMIVQ